MNNTKAFIAKYTATMLASIVFVGCIVYASVERSEISSHLKEIVAMTCICEFCMVQLWNVVCYLLDRESTNVVDN
ncbi:MAG: hypothetical protein IIT46_00595 [Lachnospiraceae bacterium]|nr:hypothetical protein [Lachnospiraceae bacterium]